MQPVDIVLPVYRNRDTLEELYWRARKALHAAGFAPRFVIVDDACPLGSSATLAVLQPADVVILRQRRNGGQQAALRRGLEHCGACPAIVMDADLQDPPEALPLLLQHLQEGNFDAVFATKSGNYSTALRRLSGRAFRAVVRLLIPLPPGAGGFVAMRAATVRRLNASTNDRFYLAGMIGCHAPRIGAVSVQRALRPVGVSSYSSIMRWRTALSNLRCILSERASNAERHP